MSDFDFRNVRTIVVKAGSSLVTNGGQGVDISVLEDWARQIAQLKEKGIRVVLVSSGAIAEGIKRLGWAKRPKALHDLQAAAAVGQMGLARAYDAAFQPFRIHTAQILLTHDDMSHRTRYLNARSTLRTLLDQGVVPVINENDTVTTDEIKLGDNDTLGALVTNLIEADALVILTDQNGLYDSDPRTNPQAKLIDRIAAGHPDLEQMAGGAGSSVGTGGMYTKVLAAKRAALSGAFTCIASGTEPDVLVRLAGGEAIGTVLMPEAPHIGARERWMMGQIQISGSLTADNGAVSALFNRHSSFLPVGCTAVEGHFERGALIAVRSEAGTEVARGLVNYNSREIERLLRHPSDEIELLLGYTAEDELIHRDNMVVRRSHLQQLRDEGTLI